MAVLLLAAGAATAKTPATPPGMPVLVPKDAAAAHRIAVEGQALDLINQAWSHVTAVRPSCRPAVQPPTSKQTHDVPAPPTLDAIAALRRPATPADAWPTRRDGSSFGFGFGETYVDYVRSVTTAAGKSFFVVIARSAQPSYGPSTACLDAQHARLLILVRDQPAEVRSAALREFDQMRRSQTPRGAAPATPQDRVFLFTKGAGGVGVASEGGGETIADFRRHGLFLASGKANASSLSGLVPDGVATVTFEYPKVISRGRDYRPTVYPSAVRRTVAVRQNALSLHV
ncbi:MAG: hypothetical protein QOK49_3284, partial [Baekduia sp.]|nr:hypothetical protein [Baekduia sp.]